MSPVTGHPSPSVGAKPCKPMLGNPTVATVPPNFTARLAATGNGENLPSAFNNARSFAASTFTSFAENESLNRAGKKSKSAWVLAISGLIPVPLEQRIAA